MSDKTIYIWRIPKGTKKGLWQSIFSMSILMILYFRDCKKKKVIQHCVQVILCEYNANHFTNTDSNMWIWCYCSFYFFFFSYLLFDIFTSRLIFSLTAYKKTNKIYSWMPLPSQKNPCYLFQVKAILWEITAIFVWNSMSFHHEVGWPVLFPTVFPSQTFLKKISENCYQF